VSRTVAALFNSRAEAELARARLIGEFGARAPRIIAKDTAAAVDGLKISRSAAATYRDGVSRGGHLLVTQVPRGTNPKRVVEVLQQSAVEDASERQEKPLLEPQQSFRVAPEPQVEPEPAAAAAKPAATPEPVRASSAPQPQPTAPPPQAAPPARSQEDGRGPADADELRIGRRAFTREATAEEQVTLREESVDVDNRASERRLSDAEVQSGGLFTDRVIEIAAMREEPVVTKFAVVREEVIVRKRVQERTETVRDTVRHTEVEVDDDAGPAFFDDRPSGRGGQR